MGKNTKTNKKATPKTTKNTNEETSKKEVKKSKKTQANNISKNTNKKNNVKTEKVKEESKNEVKKEDKNNKPKIKEEKSELKKLLILIVIIAILFLVIYFAFTYVKKNKLKNIFPNDEALGSTEIDYDKVIVGNMLKQNQDEYYVLALKTEEDETNPYESILSEYTNYQYESKIYTLDLNEVFNSKYVAEESNFDDDIKFSGTTLIKVKDGEIDETYENADEIEEELQELLEEAKENTK